MTPKFSIVIPIKNISEEIYLTLQSLICQPENIEIIVSDASSNLKLSNYIKSLNDNRFLYFKRPSNLSFSEDWEEALKYVRGTYVTILGDDDAFIPFSISHLNESLLDYDAITWTKANYCWPNHIKDNRKNTLSVESRPFSISLCPKRLLLLARNFVIGYARLPTIYNSFVHVDVINKSKENNKKGLFFGGIIPDVYSSIAIAYHSSSVLYLGYPITVNGASSRSSGVIQGKANMTPTDKLKVKDAYNAYKSYPAPANIYSQSVSTIFLGEYLLFAQNMRNGSIRKPNLKNYLKKLYQESPNYDSPESILTTAATTSSFLGVRPRSPKYRYTDLKRGMDHADRLSLLACPGEYISDVFGASKFLHSLIPKHFSPPLSRRYYFKQIFSQIVIILKNSSYLLFCIKQIK